MKKFLIINCIILSACLIAIAAFYLYTYQSYKDIFLPKTAINNIDVSELSIEKAESLIAKDAQIKSFDIKRNQAIIYTIDLTKNNTITFNFKDELKKIQSNQKKYRLLDKFREEKKHEISLNLTIDKEKLKESLQAADFMKAENQTPPKNALIKYNSADFVYEIIPEELGTTINEEALLSQIQEKIHNGIYELNLDTNECYLLPTLKKDDPNLVKNVNTANTYLQAEITYDFSDRSEVVGKKTIKEWILLNKDNVVSLDSKKIANYVQLLGQNYDTIGINRSFNSSKRGQVHVSGGDYGYRINKNKEVDNLITNIKEGKKIKREPIYSQSGLQRAANDIGPTYVEIDLTNQHVWFYSNGQLITESDCVTGNIAKKHDTPQGVYSLKYKQEDAILKGEIQQDGTREYETPVSYWMPFNGGIGLHDAYWRDAFGGTIFQTDGSHGCINLPPETAKIIFEHIEPKTPVICYF